MSCYIIKIPEEKFQTTSMEGDILKCVYSDLFHVTSVCHLIDNYVNKILANNTTIDEVTARTNVDF